MARKKENKLLKRLLFILSLFVVLLVLPVIWNYPTKPKGVLALSVESDEAVLFWQTISEENPSYMNAYIELAILEARRGNIRMARKYISDAEAINPNYEALKKTRRLLGL